jgi:hypothetical protein
MTVGLLCRLFLFTSYHAQQQQLEQVLRDELAAHLIEQVGYLREGNACL